MTTLASSLLDFILDLLRDPDAAEEFQADPEHALASAGLGDVCAADVHAVMPMLSDFAPVGAVAGIAHAAPAAAAQPAGAAPAHHDHGQDHHDDHDDHHDHRPPAEGAPAIEHLKFIQSNYTYTSTTTIDASHSVWAGEDVYQVFGEDVVLATGGSVAAGDDVERAEVDNSVDNRVDIEDSFNTEDSYNQTDSNNTDIDVENSGNTVHGDGNAVGEDNDVDNTDNSLDVDIDDSFNGNAVAGGDAVSGDGNVTGEGNVVGNEVGDVVVGEGNTVGNEVSLDVDVSDSGNTSTDSHDADLDYTNIEDSFDFEPVVVSESFNEVDASTDIEDSTLAGDDATTVADNEVNVVDNEFDD